MTDAIQEFINTKLPDDAPHEHVLTLGIIQDTESKDMAAQKKFLQEHLINQAEEHNLGTIGLEWPAFMNVFGAVPVN